MKNNIKLISVRRYPTQRKGEGEYRETITNARWTFSNGIVISVSRVVINYSEHNQSKAVIITPIGGFNETYLRVSQAMRAVQKAARQTFNYSWDVDIQL